MSEIMIENEVVMRPINTVKPYVRNPRMNQKTVELLTKIIPKVGFNVPLVIDEKGIIVKGHARFSAAIRLGMTEVPCIISHADEEAIKADRITDNKISEFSEWVTPELMEEVNSIDIDLSDIGLPKISFDEMPDSKSIGQAINEENEAIAEAQREKVYEEFVKKQGAETPVENKEDEEFGNTPFYKVVCDKCGCIMFLKESEIEGE